MTANGSLIQTTHIGTAGEMNPIPYSFELTNTGGDSPGSEFFNINTNNLPSGSVSIPSISTIGGSSGFVCTDSISSPGTEIDCFNQGPPVLAGEVITFTGTFSGYTSTAGSNQTNIFQAGTDFLDGNPSNNIANYNYQVPSSSTPDFELTTSADISITVNETGNKPFNFSLQNVAGAGVTDSSGNEIVNISLSAGTELSGGTISTDVAAWSCAGVGGVPFSAYACTNSNPLIVNETVNFSGSFSQYPNSSVGDNQAAMSINLQVADNIDANDSNNSDQTINFDVAAIPNTDLTISMLTKIDDGGNIIELNGPIPQNSEFIYAIHVDNMTGNAANNVQVATTFALGSGISLHTGTPFSFPAGNPARWSCTPNGSVGFTCNTGIVAASLNSIILVRVITSNVGTWVSGSEVTHNNDSDINNNTVSSSVTIVPIVDLTISKASSDLNNSAQDTFAHVEEFKYVLTVENLSTEIVPVGSVELSDTLQAGLSFVSNISSAEWNCPAPNGNVVVCTNINPIPGQSQLDLEIQVSGENTNTNTIEISNTATVAVIGTAAVEMETSNNFSNSALVTINPASPTDTDLTISAAPSETNVDIDEEFSFVIDIGNASGAADATNVNVITVFENASGLVTTTANPFSFPQDNPGWACAVTATGFSCDVATMANGLNSKISVTVKSPIIGNHNFTTTVTHDNDSNVNNNSLTSNITVDVPNVDVTISKSTTGLFTDGGNNLAAIQGDEVTYKVLVTNNGVPNRNNKRGVGTVQAGEAIGLTFTDTIPVGTILVPGSINVLGPSGAPNLVCAQSAADITCSVNTALVSGFPVNAGSDDGVEYKVQVTGNVGVVVPANSAIMTYTNDATPGPSSADGLSYIIASPPLPQVDLTISKASHDLNNAPKQTFEHAEEFKYVITVENLLANDAPIGSVEVRDILQAGLSFVTNLSTSDWSCPAPNGTEIVCTNLNPVVSNAPLNLELRVVGENTSAIPIQIDNTASVAVIGNAIEEVQTNNNTSNNANVTINPFNDSGMLSITKTVSGGDNAGTYNLDSGTDVIVYKLKAENTLISSFNNVSVVDDFTALSAFMDLDSATVNIVQGTSSFNCSTLSNANPILTCAGDLSAGNGAKNKNQKGGTTSVFEANISLTPTNPSPGLNNFLTLYDANNVLLAQTAVPIIIIGGETLPTVTVTQNPTSVEAGSEFDIEIEVVNNGAADLENFQIVNTLPEGFSYNNSSNKKSQAAIPAGCTINGLVVTCNVALVTSGGTYQLSLPVTAIANPISTITYTNNTLVSGGNIPTPGVTGTNTLSVTGGQQNNLDFDLTMTDDVDPVEVNTPFNYKVMMQNTGDSPITDAEFDVKIANELLILSITPSSFFTCSQSGNSVSCSLTGSGPNKTNKAGSFSIGSSDSLQLVQIQVKSPTFVGRAFSTSKATVQEVATATTVVKTAGESTDIFTTAIDLEVIKTVSVTQVPVDEGFSYKIVVKNNNDVENATGVKVIDTLPAGVTITSIDAPEWVCIGNLVIACTNNSLLAGASSEIILHAQAPSVTGVKLNTASVSADQPDDFPSNNNSQVNVTVTEAVVVVVDADLRIEKTASVQSLTSGEDLSWTLKVVNEGPVTATNIVVEDTMPAGFTYSDADIISDGQTSCNTVNGILKCTIVSMPINTEKTIVIAGVATLEEGSLSNTATVTSDHDPVSANNTSATVVVNVDAIVVVIVEKSDLAIDITAGEQIFQGQSTSFNVDITNKGDFAAQRPHVELNLSGILESATITSSLWDCGIFAIATAADDATVGNYTVACDYTDATMPLSNGTPSTILISTKTTELVQVSANLGMTGVVSSTTIDEVESNNTDTANISVNGTPTEGEIENALRTALDGTGNTQINRAIKHVASYCEISYFSALEGLCSDLYDAALGGETDVIRNVMEQITPNEVIGQSTSIAEIAQAQFRNIGARLSQVRSGGGSGFSSAGLNARYGNGSIPLGMLAYLNQTDEEVDGINTATSDFISPWGFFVNGTISMGERDATGRELEFDFDSFGLTAGVDYRLDAKKVIGVALGYANFDSKIQDSAELGSTAVTLTGYGSFYVTDNFYVDARISLAKPQFDQSREIDFTLGGVHIQRTAVGDTSANQYSVAMSAGYHFNKKSWNITPNASFRYIKTDIDGFTETGAGDFNFDYSGQEIESMVWSAGVRLSKAISLKNGVITPQLDFDYNYESLNDGNDIIARFVMAPIDEIFVIETDTPDRTYGSTGLGLVYITSNGKQAYINYRSTIGLEGFSKGTFNLGARFEF